MTPILEPVLPPPPPNCTIFSNSIPPLLRFTRFCDTRISGRFQVLLGGKTSRKLLVILMWLLFMLKAGYAVEDILEVI